MRGEHPWRLLGPEPTMEVIITYYENRSIGMQVNNYQGRPVHPDSVTHLLTGVLRGLKQARGQMDDPDAIEAAGFNLFCENERPDESRLTL